MGNIKDKGSGNFKLFLTSPMICMTNKEYFVVAICCVQSDKPYLHLSVLNKLQRRMCDKQCLKSIYKCVY